VIRVESVSVKVGKFRIDDVSFEIASGEYGMLMGKTGFGKTTLLEAVAGLRPIRAGSIVLGDRDVTDLPPAERHVGYVPQDGALFTTMSIRDHLAFALEIRHVSAAEIAARVEELAKLLEIEHLLTRSPRGLSGGERQRVAIGRALSFRPSTLLLDEPLSALDDDTREQLYSLLKHVQQHTGVTTLHVTHHIADVKRLADKLFRIENGVVEEQSR